MIVDILMAVRSGWIFTFEAIWSVRRQLYPGWQLFVGVNGLPPDALAWTMLDHLADEQVHILKYPDAANKPATLNLLAQEGRGKFVAVPDYSEL